METNLQQGSREWMQFRSRPDVISSSDFGAVCGVNPKNWTTRFELFSEKIHGRKRERNEYTTIHFLNYGVCYEPSAIDACRTILTREFEIEDLRKPGIFTHKKFDWLVSSPDLISDTEDCLCELKCPATQSDMLLHPEKGFPLQYMCQVQGQLEICEKSTCYFLVWTPTISVLYEIKRDPAFWQVMFSELYRFHGMLKTHLQNAVGQTDLYLSIVDPDKIIEQLSALNEAKMLAYYIQSLDFKRYPAIGMRKFVEKRKHPEIS